MPAAVRARTQRALEPSSTQPGHHVSVGGCVLKSLQHAAFMWSFSVTHYCHEMAKYMGDKHTVIISYRPRSQHLTTPSYGDIRGRFTARGGVLVRGSPLSKQRARREAPHPSNGLCLPKSRVKFQGWRHLPRGIALAP